MTGRKTELRKQMTKRRKRLPQPLHGEWVLPHWPDGWADLSTAGYYPIGSEFDPLPLLQTLRFAGVRTGLPRVVGKRPLEFRRWVPGELLVEGEYGTKEPGPDAPPFTPDLILVPLLAFDARGGRLGWGGGYYDRTLEANPGAIAVGLAFDEQEVESVPTEPHDRRLDAVLTPGGLRDFIREIPQAA